MTVEYSPFAKPTFTAADFKRDEPALAGDTPMFADTPIYARPKSRKAKGGIHPAALIAVPTLALALGAAVMMMGAPRDEVPPPSAAATLAPAPITAPAQTAALEAPPAMAPEAPTPIRVETPRATARVAATPTRVARARPAATPSAEAAGQDASATLPSAPMTYSGSAQTSASAPTAIVVPPVTAAPVNPAPAEATPDSAQPEAATVPTP